MASWPVRRWVVAATVTVAVLAVIGTPTGLIRTPFYRRMLAVTWWDYPVWAISATLTGLLVATYIGSPAAGPQRPGQLAAGGVLSVFAVGWPLCNKLVVVLFGVYGALTIWAPLQPIIGVLGVGLLAFALRTRLRGEPACPVPTRS